MTKPPSSKRPKGVPASAPSGQELPGLEKHETDFTSYENTPITRPEYISALVHLYRGELSRTIAWRVRLDATTNWAVVATAGLLTFVFGQGQHSQWALLAGMPVIAVFHALEARRFRLWHVWATRLRVIEENFYGPILRRDPESPTQSWGKLVAEDLFKPTFKLTRLDAMRARLVRNYWAIYGTLIAAWLSKVFLLRAEGTSLRDALGAGNAVLPWWGSLAFLGTFVAFMLALLAYRADRPRDDIEYFEVHEPSTQFLRDE